VYCLGAGDDVYCSGAGTRGVCAAAQEPRRYAAYAPLRRIYALYGVTPVTRGGLPQRGASRLLCGRDVSDGLTSL
jgi:hypothetical protein